MQTMNERPIHDTLSYPYITRQRIALAHWIVRHEALIMNQLGTADVQL